MLSMIKCLGYLKNRYMSQKAQGMVEYALIIAFVVILAAVLMSDGGLSGAISSVFGTAADTVNKANTSAAGAGN